MSQDIYTEERVAQELGIARDTVRDLRQQFLAEGMDWRMVKNEVAFTEAGLKTLGGLIDELQKNSAPSTPDEDATPEAGAGGPVEDDVATHTGGEFGTASEVLAQLIPKIAAAVPVKIKVVRSVLNPRLLIGALADGQHVRVQVRDSQKFTPGMELTCLHVQDDVYALQGRSPRNRGRW